jgi:hypothetical protein
MLAVVAVGGVGRGMALACEPIGEPKPWYATGLAQFVAVATSQRTGTTAIRASLVVGRNGAETMASGPMVLVPWSFGADCKPLAWNQTRDGVWSPPDAAAFYTGRLRDRDAWVNGIPTVDIEMARLQPIWQGGETDRKQFATARGPLLTPLEFFDFYRILPTTEELDARQPEALARVDAWESTHPQMGGREPARSMLGWLRMMWARSTAKALFCAHGSVGLQAPELEQHFAVVVVEIDSPIDTANIVVSDFGLFDRAGNVTRFKRVVDVEEFNRARLAGEGSFAYYLNSGGTQAWNGTLRAGRMRLRVRVALVDEPFAPVRFRLIVGPHVIEGPVDGQWPS